jgi:hypothetical protein
MTKYFAIILLSLVVGCGACGADQADAPGFDAVNGTDAQALRHRRPPTPSPTPTPSPSPTVTPHGPTPIGAHTFVNNRAGPGVSPMTTPSVTTGMGSTFVLFVGTTPGEFGTVTDSKNNTYQMVGSPQSYATGQGELRLFVCQQCTGGQGHTFSLIKGKGQSGGEAVLFAVEVIGGPMLDVWGQANDAGNPLGGALKTSSPNEVLLIGALAASYGSPDHYTPTDGFTLLNEQTNGTDSLAGGVAAGTAPVPGLYSVGLTSSKANNGAVFVVALK